MKKIINTKTPRQNFSILFVGMILMSLTSIQVKAEESALQSIKFAQQDYLQKDGAQLMKHIKESLIQSHNHPMILKNALSLYKVAESQGLLNNVRADWQIPPELKYLNISSQRKYDYESGRVRFFMSAGATLTEPGIVEQFQVIRYPDQIVLDKLAKVGEWDEKKWAGQPTFWTSEKWYSHPVQEGLYLINIKVKSQAMVQGWFIISDENSSASPVIRIPEINQTFTTDQPTFVWKKFHSPEYKTDEKTKINFKIYHEESNLYEEIVDAYIVEKPELNELQFRVGDRANAKNYEGFNQLNPGSYQFSIGYKEQHHFGDLILTRSSTTKVPFKILPKK